MQELRRSLWSKPAVLQHERFDNGCQTGLWSCDFMYRRCQKYSDDLQPIKAQLENEDLIIVTQRNSKLASSSRPRPGTRSSTYLSCNKQLSGGTVCHSCRKMARLVADYRQTIFTHFLFSPNSSNAWADWYACLYFHTWLNYSTTFLIAINNPNPSKTFPMWWQTSRRDSYIHNKRPIMII